jgi:hypothetical protein
MAFPNNPSNGDTFVRYGRTYQYDSAMLMWKVPKSGILLGELADIDITTNPPIVGDALRWSGSKFEPETINTVTVYQTDLPLTGNTVGNMAYITDLSSLYIFNGGGWFNVAIINTNPTITTGPSATYTLDGINLTPTVITLVATDPEGIPITWSHSVTSGSLEGTTITNVDNVFTITPGTIDASFYLTFTASDGVNLATAASSFTLRFNAAQWKYANLSIGTSSTNGLTNSSFEDKSSNTFTVTPTGNVTQSPFNPHLEKWSNYFGAYPSYFTVPTTTGLSFGTGNFTVEAWVYKTDTVNASIIDARVGTGTASPWLFGVDATTNRPYFYQGTLYYSSIAIALNEWTHVAVTRSSGVVKIFVNGVQGFSASITTNLDRTSGAFIGSRAGGANGAQWGGYISDLRVVKGTALYTSNFTPPTESLTAISGTTLLTCQSNRLVDNSVSNLTITSVGGMKVESISPYNNNSYTAQLGSGSGYFDGAGDYLQVGPDAAFGFGTGDFTFEAWVYARVSSTTMVIADVTLNIATMYVNSSNTLHFYAGGVYDSGLTVISNAWNHVACVRSSGSFRMYVNGVGNSPVSMTTNFGSNEQMRVGTENGADWNGYISNFRAVKGTAVYTSNFTPPTEPLTAISGTSLLVQFDNAGIYDKTTQNELTLIGNTATSVTQTKYADTSIYFDGTGDYITAPQISFGTSDFTIEGWHYLTSKLRDYPTLFSNYSTFGAGAIGIFAGHIGGFEGSTKYQVSWNGAFPSINAGTILYNEWVHFALVRESGTVTLYINGVSVGSFAGAQSMNGNGTNVYIGAVGSDLTTSQINGYLENYQVFNGLAKYTSNFTVPTREQGSGYQTIS